MKQRFRLFTWQNPDWDITKEKRDPSKGPQDWGTNTWDKLQPLYAKLKGKIGTLDFVRCFAEYKHWNQSEIRRLWVLDVPSSEILNFLDYKIWEVMLGDVGKNKQPEDISWDKLILERSEAIKRLSAGNNADITPLVAVPLSPLIRVIDKSKFNKGPTSSYSNAKYENLPTSESEAKKYRDEGYNRGS